MIISKKVIYFFLFLPAFIFLLLPTLLGELGKKTWKKLLIHSGFCTLGLLVFCLILLPLKKCFPKVQVFKDLNRYKREVGLAVFVYVCAHFAFSITDAIVRKGHFEPSFFLRPVIFPGFLAFLILFALGLTGNDWSIQKLTHKKWKELHQFVYAAELLIFIHVLLQSEIYAFSIFIPLFLIQGIRIRRDAFSSAERKSLPCR